MKHTFDAHVGVQVLAVVGDVDQPQRDGVDQVEGPDVLQAFEDVIDDWPDRAVPDVLDDFEDVLGHIADDVADGGKRIVGGVEHRPGRVADGLGHFLGGVLDPFDRVLDELLGVVEGALEPALFVVLVATAAAAAGTAGVVVVLFGDRLVRRAGVGPVVLAALTAGRNSGGRCFGGDCGGDVHAVDEDPVEEGAVQ